MANDGEKVVYLAFDNPKAVPDEIVFIACRHCRNKTYTMTKDDRPFNILKCAACGDTLGRMGWAPADT